MIKEILYHIKKKTSRIIWKYLKIYEKIIIAELIDKFKSKGENIYIEYPAIIHGQENIRVGSNFFARGGLRLEAHKTFNNIEYDSKIIIGNNVQIAGNVLITDHFHGKISA